MAVKVAGDDSAVSRDGAKQYVANHAHGLEGARGDVYFGLHFQDSQCNGVDAGTLIECTTDTFAKSLDIT